MSANCIRKHILIPLAITLLVLLATFLFSISRIKLKEISETFEQRYQAVTTLSQKIRSERGEFMELALQLISRDARLQEAMIGGHREELLSLSAELFETALRPRNISHFYFHRPDGHVFLRVHHPSFFGDRINRVTLTEAMVSDAVVCGTELGPLGTLTHRMVMPWLAGGHLIGYIEIGEDIDWFMARLRESVDIEYAIVLDKKFLDRNGWEKGSAMLGLSTNWDHLPDHVLMDHSLEKLPEEFLDSLDDDRRLQNVKVIQVESDDREFRGRTTPLTGAEGQVLGEILVMLEVTDKIATFNHSMITGTGLTLLLGGGLFVFSYIMLGKTSRHLIEAQDRLYLEFKKTKETNCQLEYEMAERRAAQESLKKVNEDLEKRVFERTEELESARDDLRRVIDHAHSLILTTDARGDIKKWNRTAERLTGIPREEVLEKNLTAKVLEERCKSRGEKMLERILSGESITNFEFPFHNQHGERIELLLNATGRRDAQGRITGAIIVCQDITSRKRSEEVLRSALIEARQAQERIAVILRSLSDGLLVIDESGKVLVLNEVACTLFQLDHDLAVGQPFEELFMGSEVVPHLRHALAPCAAGTSLDFEMEDQAGDKLVIHARTSPLQAPSGERDGILVLLQDVTQQRAVDRLKSEFISTVAHEFRTPLSTVLGFSELLLNREDFTREQRREFLSYIYKKAESLSGIVDDLLDLSRIESGREIALKLEVFDPCEALHSVIRNFELQYPEYSFHADCESCRQGIRADRRKFGQVMENLLSNAVKYSPKSRQVVISGQCLEKVYQVEVQDWGIGMSPEQIAHVFDKFYRADSSNIAISGTGLGMSIVKHIIEAHDGQIWVKSEAGIGTQVIFTLPSQSFSFL